MREREFHWETESSIWTQDLFSPILFHSMILIWIFSMERIYSSLVTFCVKYGMREREKRSNSKDKCMGYTIYFCASQLWVIMIRCVCVCVCIAVWPDISEKTYASHMFSGNAHTTTTQSIRAKAIIIIIKMLPTIWTQAKASTKKETAEWNEGRGVELEKCRPFM